ncbi:MAG: tetratricopeptide repeat protein [Vicinamibacterales bacterium]
MAARSHADLHAALAPQEPPWPQPIDGTTVVAVADDGGRAAAVAGAALRRLGLDSRRPVLEPAVAAEWPFTHPLVVPQSWPADAVIWVPGLEAAFENRQTNSTRLVTTQPLYLMQVWRDALATRPDVVFVATATAGVLAEHASEAIARRGPWRHVSLLTADGDGPSSGAAWNTAPFGALAAAFRAPDPADRLAACGRALDEARTAPRLLAMASVCMEVNDLDNARTLTGEAVAAAPEWSAAHFEHAKAWLRLDDMARAAEAFGRASALMPTFTSAAANWGATLGELDRPEEALAAFSRALESDPANHQALNNLGVVYRELGRLPESEQAFRQVIAMTPGLAFGHYNLGHTLFLQGRYQAALAAYVTGQRHDPARNPVQASRLALARLATGDAAGALRDLQSCTAALPAGYRRQVLQDTHAVAWALLSASPEVPGWHLVGDWLSAELAR